MTHRTISNTTRKDGFTAFKFIKLYFCKDYTVRSHKDLQNMANNHKRRAEYIFVSDTAT